MKMFSRWYARREVRRQLQALSDRELKDIGVVRGDIPRIVSEM